VKPRPLTSAERKAQILALWQGRPPDERRRADVASFFKWLSDYAPWLIPSSEPALKRLVSIVESHVVDE
jgi:hypothetical protein